MSNTNELKELQEKIKSFETFVTRRFDEISMEINATSQLLDMAEDGAEKRFTNMLNALSSITDFNGGQTAANSGAELEAAVIDSENAANKIMDATENISALLSAQWDKTDDMEMVSFIESIDKQVQDILIACSFQDLVGQRIRKATEALKDVEDELSQTMGSFGLNKETGPSPKKEIPATNTVSSQADIDALFD
jgi:chemotaxis regulatin CheY-phosphate phosphatase CheZ